ECARCLSRDARRQLGYAMQAVDALARRLVHPAARLRALEKELVHSGRRLAQALARRLEAWRARAEKLQVLLASFSPEGVLARGYSITLDAEGKVLTDAARAKAGERITTRLSRGSLESEVKRKPR
ncbi:MAG TPA: exodeoxyribonuclease VII large subunit, partial [Burkholderiales bacterium]|nr:exodeoxyribonuclease VII large subunit [Burkholderiales bacterium]